MYFLSAMAVQWLLENSAYREAVTAEVATTSKESEGIMARVLSSMCDGVVHLDSDLVITISQPRVDSSEGCLANTLMIRTQPSF